MDSHTIIVAVLILGFSLIVFGVAVGSAIGDGIVASKAVESIARQPEAQGRLFSIMFIIIGLVEAMYFINFAIMAYFVFVLYKK